jgi:hypothetical protein
MIAKVNALWEMRSAGGEELSALLPSILRPHEVPVALRSGREGRLEDGCDMANEEDLSI